MGYQQQYQHQLRYRLSIANTHSAATAFRAFRCYPVEDPAFAGHPLGGGFYDGALIAGCGIRVGFYFNF